MKSTQRATFVLPAVLQRGAAETEVAAMEAAERAVAERVAGRVAGARLPPSSLVQAAAGLTLLPSTSQGLRAHPCALARLGLTPACTRTPSPSLVQAAVNFAFLASTSQALRAHPFALARLAASKQSKVSSSSSREGDQLHCLLYSSKRRGSPGAPAD